MLSLVELIHRSAHLAFTRVSGLSDLQWRVIARVNEAAPLSMNQLAALLQRDTGQVSRAVKGLVGAGLLNRATRTGGPGVLITPTHSGRTAYGPVKRLARQRNEAFLNGLTPEEVRAFERYMAIVTRNAQFLLAQEMQRAQDAGPQDGSKRRPRKVLPAG